LHQRCEQPASQQVSELAGQRRQKICRPASPQICRPASPQTAWLNANLQESRFARSHKTVKVGLEVSGFEQNMSKTGVFGCNLAPFSLLWKWYRQVAGSGEAPGGILQRCFRMGDNARA
jgi:hypothetical protein